MIAALIVAAAIAAAPAPQPTALFTFHAPRAAGMGDMPGCAWTDSVAPLPVRIVAELRASGCQVPDDTLLSWKITTPGRLDTIAWKIPDCRVYGCFVRFAYAVDAGPALGFVRTSGCPSNHVTVWGPDVAAHRMAIADSAIALETATALGWGRWTATHASGADVGQAKRMIQRAAAKIAAWQAWKSQ